MGRKRKYVDTSKINPKINYRIGEAQKLLGGKVWLSPMFKLGLQYDENPDGLKIINGGDIIDFFEERNKTA